MEYKFDIVNGKAVYKGSKGWVDDSDENDKKFYMNKNYKKFCREIKPLVELEYEMKMLKQKLDYEYKTYGEVDKIDYDRYMSYIMGSYK